MSLTQRGVVMTHSSYIHACVCVCVCPAVSVPPLLSLFTLWDLLYLFCFGVRSLYVCYFVSPHSVLLCPSLRLTQTPSCSLRSPRLAASFSCPDFTLVPSQRRPVLLLG